MRPADLPAGEEDDGAGSLDGRGGSGVAVFDGTAHVLPAMGRYRKENLVMMPRPDRTVIVGLEDGPPGFTSQLMLHDADRDPRSADPLRRNGLIGGTLYVFASDGPRDDESAFHQADGELTGRWVPLPGAAGMDETALDATARAAGAFGFARIEDGAFDRERPGVFWFATTGGEEGNARGRIYSLTLSPAATAASPARLAVVLEGDAGDPIVNPDNLAAAPGGWLAIQEDPIEAFRGGALGGGESSIWLYHPATGRLIRAAEVNQQAVPEAQRGPAGSWESSGIIDLSDEFKPGTWMLTVQAHSVKGEAAAALQGLAGDAGLAEGGQILLLDTAAITAATNR